MGSLLRQHTFHTCVGHNLGVVIFDDTSAFSWPHFYFTSVYNTSIQYIKNASQKTKTQKKNTMTKSRGGGGGGILTASARTTSFPDSYVRSSYLPSAYLKIPWPSLRSSAVHVAGRKVESSASVRRRCHHTAFRLCIQKSAFLVACC